MYKIVHLLINNTLHDSSKFYVSVFFFLKYFLLMQFTLLGFFYTQGLRPSANPHLMSHKFHKQHWDICIYSWCFLDEATGNIFPNWLWRYTIMLLKIHTTWYMPKYGRVKNRQFFLGGLQCRWVKVRSVTELSHTESHFLLAPPPSEDSSQGYSILRLHWKKWESVPKLLSHFWLRSATLLFLLWEKPFGLIPSLTCIVSFALLTSFETSLVFWSKYTRLKVFL